MTLTAIVAMTPERVIGRNGTLPWHLPDDLKFFKKTTSGHPIVMGRKTFDSIGKALPKRQNIVLTHDQNWAHEGIDVIHEISELETLELMHKDIFIIGGSQIYKAFLPHLDAIIVTHVHKAYPGDTHLPDFETFFSQCEILESHPDFVVKRYTKETKE